MDPHGERRRRSSRHPSRRHQHSDSMSQAPITGDEDYDENGNLRFVLDSPPSGDEDYDEHDNLRFVLDSTPSVTCSSASRGINSSRVASHVSNPERQRATGPLPPPPPPPPPPGMGERQWAWIQSQQGRTREHYTPSINSRIENSRDEPIGSTSSSYFQRHSGNPDSSGSRPRVGSASNTHPSPYHDSSHHSPSHHHSRSGSHPGERHHSRSYTQSSHHGYQEPPRAHREESHREPRDRERARANDPRLQVCPGIVRLAQAICRQTGSGPEKKDRDRHRK